jgi:sugar/nucleoside kinase (ribokinase family)
MKNSKKVKLVVVGSIALDTIETPLAKECEIPGGSASFACAAASLFSRTGMIGIVGDDFPEQHIERLSSLNIDLKGLEKVKGKTFRWSGIYENDMNNRRTISTELNVFADFNPKVPESYAQAPYLLLANIAPSLQLSVLNQMRNPKFVAVDTMDLWINTAKQDLLNLLKRSDLLFLNESEARHLAAESSLFKAAKKLLELGPQFIVIKKGEHGSMLFSKNSLFIMPAFPLEEVYDPTGAGDSFAGAFMGWLAKRGKKNIAIMRKAMLLGTVAASFAVEKFSIEGLAHATQNDLKTRARLLRNMVHI